MSPILPGTPVLNGHLKGLIDRPVALSYYSFGLRASTLTHGPSSLLCSFLINSFIVVSKASYCASVTFTANSIATAPCTNVATTYPLELSSASEILRVQSSLPHFERCAMKRVTGTMVMWARCRI